MINLTAREAVAAMISGEISAAEYADALLLRCAAGRALNAFITLDPESVREAARAVDSHYAAGKSLGPLHGLPIPIKDSVNTKDLPTTAGTNALRGFTPSADATAVAKLRSAGAIVLGKTNLHELSFGWTSNNLAFGPVRNPYDPGRIPGGSSGGTSAAIAARMAPLGLAEDTQGSIRVPAALCGVFGFRPTTGRYPNDGVAPITPLFDQVGPHARSVDDLALFDAVMTGDDRPLAPAPLKGLRLGIARGYHFRGLDPAVEQITDEVLARLRAAGVELVEAEIPGLAELVELVTIPVQIHDAATALKHYLSESAAPVSFDQLVDQISPDVRGIFDRYILPGASRAITDEAYTHARDVDRPAMQRLFARYFEENRVTALLFPTTLAPATPIGEAETVRIRGVQVPFPTAMARNIAPGSSAGLPGLVIPAGLTSDTRLPVAIEIDGRPGDDRGLLAVGLAIERELGPLAAPVLAPA